MKLGLETKLNSDIGLRRAIYVSIFQFVVFAWSGASEGQAFSALLYNLFYFVLSNLLSYLQI